VATPLRLERGRVLVADLSPTVGHEQAGRRPCVAVSDPAVNASLRFPLIAVVPLTATLGAGALYPVMSPGASGLRRPSAALVDQLRSIDKRRVRRVFGTIAPTELAAIDHGLSLFLGLQPDVALGVAEPE
jgi:mRNA interferase MazF